MYPKTPDEDRSQQLIALNREASKPVLADLSKIGFNLEWISDLFNKRYDYRKAIPVLLEWLPRSENLAVKEEIVRALSVPWAKHTAASKLLVEEFRKPVLSIGFHWAIGNALSVVADEEVLDDIVGFIRDESYGTARQMLVIALGNMKAKNVNNLLIELLDNEELVGFATISLGKLKCKEARPRIEELLTHPKSWIRREAKKALTRIDKVNM